MTTLVKGLKSKVKMIAPTKLNVTWAAAVRLAATLAPKAAITAVIVVPILSPKRIGKAAASPKLP